MIASLVTQLKDKDTWAITANNRLSRFLQQEYQVQHQHLSTWPAPCIMPMSIFLSQSLEKTQHEIVLSANQAMHLWESCMPDIESPIRAHLLSQSTYHAWSLYCQWQCPIFTPQNANQRLFMQWCKTYQHALHQRQCLDPHQMPEALHSVIAHHPTILPKKIIWVGIHEPPPHLSALMQTLNELCQCTHFSPPQASIQLPKRLACPSRDDEIITMARWAYAQDEQTMTGCIVPNLNEDMALIQYHFDEIALSQDREQANFSLTPALIELNVIQDILSLISPELFRQSNGADQSKKSLDHGLRETSISIESVSAWLFSPYIGNKAERSGRLTLELLLREQQHTHFSLDEILALGQAHCPLWCNVLNQHFKLWLSQPKQFTFHQFKSAILSSINLWNWPHTAFNNDLSEENTQHSEKPSSKILKISQQWLMLLNKPLLSHQFIQKSTSIQDAYQILRYLTETTRENNAASKSNIHVLGALEAYDIPFTQTWMMGCNERQWPPSPSPSAFLPYKLQQALEMPHATTQKEWDFCHSFMLSLQRSPSICSYAEWDDDSFQQASPLIKDGIHTMTLDELNLTAYQKAYQKQISPNAIALLSEAQAPPLQTTHHKGGAALLEQQAQCPFKAFAIQRLRIQPYPEVFDGLGPQLRGILLHACMADFWEKHKNQQQLLALSEAELGDHINSVIEKNLNKAQRKDPKRLTPKRKWLESHRLQQHMHQWIKGEKERPSFQVSAIEHPIKVELAQLNLTLRIDRIDTLADGAQLVIDYKTGQVQRQHWLATPLLSPQLPIYSMVNPDQIEGIAFAQIKSKQWQWSGISKTTLDIKGIMPWQKLKHDFSDWQAITQHWRDQVNQFAHEFCAGEASVRPQSPEVCRHCHLHGLCRVNM